MLTVKLELGVLLATVIFSLLNLQVYSASHLFFVLHRICKFFSCNILSPAGCIPWSLCFACFSEIFTGVSEGSCASAIASAHRDLFPWSMHREAGGCWIGEHMLNASCGLSSCSIHTHFIKLMAVLLILLVTNKTVH